MTYRSAWGRMRRPGRSADQRHQRSPPGDRPRPSGARGMWTPSRSAWFRSPGQAGNRQDPSLFHAQGDQQPRPDSGQDAPELDPYSILPSTMAGNSSGSASCYPRTRLAISLALDLNDRGQVIGTGITPYRDHHGFLLDPVPEPAWFPWLLAGTVLTGVGQSVRIDMRRSLISMMSSALAAGQPALDRPQDLIRCLGSGCVCPEPHSRRDW